MAQFNEVIYIKPKDTDFSNVSITHPDHPLHSMMIEIFEEEGTWGDANTTH